MDHAQIVEGLTSVEAFPFEADGVEVVQTAISSVLLAGEYAYKLKKPVRFDFVDFSTLEKRHYFCDRELRLNKRLAPGIYLEVVPIVSEAGKLRLEGRGEPVEYAVKMRRLPQDRMMNVLLQEEHVEPSAVDSIASEVAAFHARAESGPEITCRCEPDSLKAELEEDLGQVQAFAGGSVAPEVLADIAKFMRSWIADHAALLSERVARMRIRDCHGDMHSGNICLPDSVEIFDCIEFNDDFRYIDVAREVAFLAMDLDSFDESALSGRYVDAYVELSGDATLPELLDFYKAWLAVIRGKVYSIPAEDESISVKERKHSVYRARRYFELAHRYSGGRDRPIVLVMMGAMGSGKSALAQVLAKRLYLHVVDSDYVRKALVGIDPEERRNVGYGEDIYSPEMTDKVYRALADIARSMSAEGYSVIVEASYAQKHHRDEIVAAAREVGARVLFVYCTAEVGVLRQRLVDREQHGKGPSDGRIELLSAQLERFEAPTEVAGGMMLELDTDHPLDDLADEVLDRVSQECGAAAAARLSLQ